MASVVRYRNGWRAYAYTSGKRATKTFRLKSHAEAWAAEVEANGASVPFSVAAERFLAIHLPKLTSAANQRTYEQSIRDHVLPAIGKVPLRDLTRTRLVEVVRNLSASGKVETAHRVGQRISAILDHAVDSGDIESHAGSGLSRVLPAPKKRHMPAVSPADLPPLLQAIHSYPEPVTRTGLLLLAHTLVRTNELVGARWDELKGDLWVIPADRMKADKPHVVPITTQIRALLDNLATFTGDSRYWLASRNPLVPISTNTMLFALYRLGYRGRMTGHGFRSVASTVLNESGLWRKDAIERQLAHKETDDVRGAYNRADYLDERRAMMAWYGAYLEASTSKINV